MLGGGPAGLTAAYVLGKAGRKAIVLEADRQVGGLAKTVEIDGFRFDLGGHRFFTKAHEVETLWHEIMGDEFLLRPRMSRIYWNGKFPRLSAARAGRDPQAGPDRADALHRLVPQGGAPPEAREDSLEDWVSNRFGRRLFELFFKTYTEKVWGVPTSEIRAEWAAQRIKGLSFTSAAQGGVLRKQGQQGQDADLRVPLSALRAGPDVGGDGATDRRRGRRGSARDTGRADRDREGRVAGVDAGGATYRARTLSISSLPLRDIVAMADPRPADEVLEAARGLRYRDFLTVALVVSGEDLFPDNWIYIHEPAVRVGRIQNYRSWSPWMVPDPKRRASASSTSASPATTSGR